ncbi:hypothetical protein CIB48_g2256 [Xylaria polymorpha]|nr:hypothetical protein CIB48_g2256 [Xylaria polymorpha]
MDDLPIDTTTWQDHLEDTFLDTNALRGLAAAAIRESGRSIPEPTPVLDNFNSISDGANGPVDHALDPGDRNVPRVSQVTTTEPVDACEDTPVDVSWDEPDLPTDLSSSFGNHDSQQPNQATTSAPRDANKSTRAVRFSNETGAPDNLFLGSRNRSPHRLSQATTRAIGDTNEGPCVAGVTGTGACELVDRDSTLGNDNLLQPSQPSQPSQVTAGGAGESAATGTSGERAVDGSNLFRNDIAVSRKHPKRRRGVSGDGDAGRPRPPNSVRNVKQVATKRQLAARPVPILFSGYPVPVATTVRDTQTIQRANLNMTGTPLSIISPLAFTTTTGGVTTGLAQTSMFSTTGQAVAARTSLMLTTSSFTTGQAGTSEGAMPSLAQMPISSTTGQAATAAPARPEELEQSPLIMIAARARAQLQSNNTDQALKLHQRLPDFQGEGRLRMGLNELGGVQKECRGVVDTMVSDFDPRPPPRRFEAPRIEFARQQRYAVDRRSFADSRYMNTTKGKPIFIEDHSKDPITTPPKDKKAHSAEFTFRWKLHIGRESLETIRLLQAVWSPALTEKRDIIDTDEIPEYNLRELPYDKHPRYMALSYTWGEEYPTRAISINGTIVHVRSNLARALQSITHFNPSMYVWVDAICINQQDEREKSRMVPQMPDIFASAWLVYAWLGPARDSSTKDLLTHFSDLGKLFWQQAGSTDFDDKLSERSVDIDTNMTRNIEHLLSRFKHPPGKQGVFPTEEYSSFSASPFWSRIWVLQEVYLAKRLYYACGSCYVASNLLAGALILLEAFQRHLIRKQASALECSVPVRDESDELLRKFALKLPSFPEMHRLIVYTSIYPIDVVSLRIAMTNFCVKELPGGSKATDPKDMIYGLMGFCNDEERSYIKADYSKSVQETYTAVTRAMIRNGFTDILSWAQPDAKRIAYLPSWVPDYSSTIYESLCSQGQAKPWLPQFRACNETKYSHDETMHPLDPLAMPVHGRRLDQVIRVGRRWFPRSPGGSTPSSTNDAGALLVRSVSYEDLRFFMDEVCEFTRLAEEIHNHLVETGRIGRTRQVDKKSGAWRVPCCDQMVINDRLVRGDPSTESRYEAMMGYLDAYKQEPKNEVPAESRPYLESLMRWADKRPFVTEQGFVGLGSANTTPGDTVAVLDGFNACYLIRLDSVSRLDYCLVGEAYVDGIMDGEMVGSIPDTRVWFHLV